MWMSRIWVTLLAVAVTCLLAIAMLTPRPAARDLASAHAYKLDLVQHSAELLMRLDSRKSIDVAANLATDGQLTESLSKLARARDVGPLYSDISAALHALLAQIPADRRPELIIALDGKGKEIARIGPGDEEFTPGQSGLAGYPLVAAALRGYLRDDAWSLDGQLYRMAAVPILSPSKQRFVGALVTGDLVDTAYAQRLKTRLIGSDIPFVSGTEVSVFLRGKMIASTMSSTALSKLPLQYGKRRRQLQHDGRSAALQIGEGPTAHIVVMAPFEGEAAAHDAFYALVAPPPPPSGVIAALKRLQLGDINTHVILTALGTLAVLVLVGLLVLQIWIEIPFVRFASDMRRVTHGEQQRLTERHYSGIRHDLARLINEALDRQGKRSTNKAGAQRSSGRGQAEPESFGGMRAAMPPLAQPPAEPLPPLADVQPLIGTQPLDGGDDGLEDTTSPRGGYDDAGGIMPPVANAMPADAFVPGALQGPGLAAIEEDTGAPASGGGRHINGFGPPHRGTGGEARDPFLGAQPLMAIDSSEQVTEAGPIRIGDEKPPIRRSREFADDLPLLKPVELPPATEDNLPDFSAPPAPDPLTGSPGWSGMCAPSAIHDAVEPIAIPDALSSPTTSAEPSGPLKIGGAEDEDNDTVMSSVPQHMARSLRGTQAGGTADSAGDASGDATLAEDQESHFKKIFQEFLTVKRTCGESTQNLTYERFSEKLRKNRESLMSRYDCRDVRFKVYVKDGKAALKATPLQD